MSNGQAQNTTSQPPAPCVRFTLLGGNPGPAHHRDPDAENNYGASPRSLASKVANYDLMRFFRA